MGSTISGAYLQSMAIPVTILNIVAPDPTNMYPKQANLINDTCTQSCNNTSDRSPSCPRSPYDYIIIGGGTAGCVLARRLSEDKKNNILVLEAGSDPPITALLAGRYATLPKSNVDYDYHSTFDAYAAESQGNRTVFTAGKMLGGSASLNHFIHVRGCPTDFDQWAVISGEDSWQYRNFLEYFKRSERLDNKEILEKYKDFHGTNGPTGLNLQATDSLNPYSKSFSEIGIPTIPDINGDTCIGCVQPQYTLSNQQRQTPALTYLNKVKDYNNLNVSKNTLVTRILFEDTRAVAVEAVYQGATYILRANKEILLCAGAIKSPQLLMLSGIGPKSHLSDLGITVKSDLPVGDNFIEQVATTVVFKTKQYVSTVFNPFSIAINITRYPVDLLVGLVALDRSQSYPDYQFYSGLLSHDSMSLSILCSNVHNYRQAICDRLQQQVTGHDVLYTTIMIGKPKSRGTIRLKSTNPNDNPLITTGFFTEKEDLSNMVKYVKDFIKVNQTSFFRNVEAEIVGLDIPDCSCNELDDDFWSCYVRKRAISLFHYMGTCAMGSVVDGKLQVMGFKRLRVIDASCIPYPPQGGPNPAVLAIAENAADMIKSTDYY